MSALTRKWVLVLRSSCHKELPLCRGETGRPRTVTQQDAHHGQIAHSHLIRNVVYEYSQEISCGLNSYLSGLFSHAGHNSIAKWLHQLQASCLYSRQEEREKDRNYQLYFVIYWEKQKTSQKPQHTLVTAHWSEQDHRAPLPAREGGNTNTSPRVNPTNKIRI